MEWVLSESGDSEECDRAGALKDREQDEPEIDRVYESSNTAET